MEETLNTEQNKKSISAMLASPFIVVYNIITYTFIGIKAVFFDMWVNLYNTLSYQTDKAYRVTKNIFEEDEFDLYERTRRKRKEKVYKYSEKTLRELEELKAALQIDLQNAGASRTKTPHVYQFKVKDAKGKIITDTMNGFSKLDINAYLLNEGYEVYDIKTSPWIDFVYKDTSFMGKKMSTKDLIFWLTQLSTYLKAGLTLSASIKILNTQMKGNKSRSRAFESISYELVLGESFSKAMEKQGNMFPALLINMIKAAEASGTLNETLEDMANYYTEIDETKKQMISALTYPVIITVFAICVIIFILLYVVPQFTSIYAEQGAEMTGITKIVIDVSDFLRGNYLTLFSSILMVIIFIIIIYRSVKAFRATIQIMIMHIPVIKNVIIYNEMAIFSKTFASLLRNNVFITDSMDILSKITKNEIYKAILYKTINNIVKGEKISEAFKDHWAVPPVAYYMIVTGEETGDLASMMQKVSEYYQSMHKSIVTTLKAFIEPIMITFLAVIVGLIVIAVIVPMFDIYNNVQM